MVLDADGSRLPPFRRLVSWLVYVSVRLTEAVVLSMSPDAADGLARVAGGAFFRFHRPRRRTVLENLRIAFGEWTVEKRERVARAAFSHAFLVGIEMIRRPRVLHDVRAFRTRGRYFGPGEMLRQEVREGQAGVFLGGHIGNWELSAACLQSEGVPLSVVARPLGNPYLDDYVANARGGKDSVIFKSGAVRAVRGALEGGRWVGIVADQNAGRHGVFIPFFGLPACTYPFAASIAVREKRPVWFGAAMRRGKSFRYDYFVERYRAAPTGDEDVDARRILEAFHAFLEERVRERPEQYFWLHRRWKTRPPGEVRGPHLPNYG